MRGLSGRTAVLVVALSLLFSAAAVSAGCGRSIPVLSYDSSPGNVVAELKSFGGLVPQWADEVPDLRLYGDGKVVRKDGSGRLLVEGRLDEEQVKDLLEKIGDTGFFNLKASYFDRRVMDGATTEVSVNLTGEKKKVDVYMMKVKPFNETVGLLMDYPLGGQKTYVPDRGYLVVTEREEASPDTAGAPPEIAALLPDGATLLQAADGRKPIEIPGEAFAKIAEYDSKQQYSGTRVTVDGRHLTVSPVYQPGSINQTIP